MENCTADVEDAAKISVDSTSVISQEKQGGNEEDRQVNIYDKNDANKSNEETREKKLNKM